MEEQRLERRDVYYQGRVQGVGFRYTVRSIARHFRVAGFVKNLPDGRVQLVAEGEPAEVQGFLNEISDQMGRYITGVREQATPTEGRYASFDIRF